MRALAGLAPALLATVAAGALPLTVRAALRAADRAAAIPRHGSAPTASRSLRPGEPHSRAGATMRVAWARLDPGRGLVARRRALGSVLAALVPHLQSGGSLHQAMAAVGANAPPALTADLGEVMRRARHGGGLADGLGWWADRRADEPAVRMLAAALAIASETGGPAVAAVESVAEVVRDRNELAAEVGALTAQARASAVVIGCAPVAMALLAAAADPGTGRFLLTTWSGVGMLTAGLLLDLLGAAWMASMLRAHR